MENPGPDHYTWHEYFHGKGVTITQPQPVLFLLQWQRVLVPTGACSLA